MDDKEVMVKRECGKERHAVEVAIQAYSFTAVRAKLSACERNTQFFLRSLPKTIYTLSLTGEGNGG